MCAWPVLGLAFRLGRVWGAAGFVSVVRSGAYVFHVRVLGLTFWRWRFRRCPSGVAGLGALPVFSVAVLGRTFFTCRVLGLTFWRRGGVCCAPGFWWLVCGLVVGPGLLRGWRGCVLRGVGVGCLWLWLLVCGRGPVVHEMSFTLALFMCIGFCHAILVLRSFALWGLRG